MDTPCCPQRGAAWAFTPAACWGFFVFCLTWLHPVSVMTWLCPWAFVARLVLCHGLGAMLVWVWQAAALVVLLSGDKHTHHTLRGAVRTPAPNPCGWRHTMWSALCAQPGSCCHTFLPCGGQHASPLKLWYVLEGLVPGERAPAYELTHQRVVVMVRGCMQLGLPARAGTLPWEKGSPQGSALLSGTQALCASSGSSLERRGHNHGGTDRLSAVTVTARQGPATWP
jgi:hypothetical protein